MKFYEASATIHASADAVWAILVDGSRYPEWDSGVVRVEGRVAPGEKIKVVSEANPKRAFPVTVSEFRAPSRMTWSGGMPLGLFKGVRTFTLQPSGDDTAFSMREEYTGPMLPMIWKSMPDLQPSFDKFARGLKQRAEQQG
ncbi:MAG: SRPBCC domain-containing protein [Actinomycetota bacterium]|nr:SRPBCC domain-containing protein [Actinomycetota bacterium]